MKFLILNVLIVVEDIHIGMTDYKVIKGHYHVKKYSPDGDSIRFQAEDETNWNYFNWKSDYKKKCKKKQLRIEAIDALETHIDGFKQPQAFAVAALETMLSLIGITDIEYSLSVTKIVDANDVKPGYIVSSTLDMFDRPVCYVFNDINGLNDGDVIQGGNIPVERSINYILVRDGLVYPTYYLGIENSIRQKFTEVVEEARMNRRGVWTIDRTHGFTLWNMGTIQSDVVILPKLFRRFVAFFQRRKSYDEFMKYLEDNEDPVQLISDGTDSNLHDLLYNQGKFYQLTVRPEMIIFKPKG